MRQGSVSARAGKTERERREQTRFQTEIRPDIKGAVYQRGKSEEQQMTLLLLRRRNNA